MPTPRRIAGSVPVWRSGAGPARRRPPPLPPLPTPVTALDAPSEGDGTVSQLIETAVPSYLSIEALVELACRSQCGADWRSMYTVVRRQLVSMRLLPAHSDQLDPLRHMYQKMFADLLLAAQRASLPGPLTDGPLLGPAPGGTPLLHASRYRTEFEELSVLGSGGFAVVCRCRSLVDRQEYAVKRIPFRCRTAVAAERTVREVAVFASLDHPNIVKYNTAWLEAGGPRPAEDAPGKTSTPSRSDTGGAGDSGSWVEFERPAPAGRSLGSLTALTTAGSLPPPADSSTGFVVSWDRTSVPAQSTDSSSGAVLFDSVSREAVSTPASSRAAVSPADPDSSRGLAVPPDRSPGEMVSSPDNSAPVPSQDGSSEAVLPSGSFGRRPAVVSRFWASAGSSSGSESAPLSTSASSAARSHSASASHPVARSQSAAAASSVSGRSLSRYRRSVSAPAGSWLTLHIQMQLCERTLKDWLQERNQAPPPAEGRLTHVDAARCCRLLRDVLLGVHFIHQRGVIHRDLKPANIFIGFSGRAMIGDFGLARPGGGGGGTGGPSPPLTPLAEQTGGVGTATYASPEQAAGGDYDQSTDLYSLGVITYELFAPFGTAMERGRELQRLRRERRCAADVAARWPAVAAAVVGMTEEQRTLRPCAAHLLTSPLFSSPADRLLHLEAAAAHQSQLLEARAARSRQLAEQLDSCRREAAVTERLLRNNCRQLRRQLTERDREVERLRVLLKRAGVQPP